MAFKFYTSMAKGLELNVEKFWILIPTIVKATGEELVRRTFLLSTFAILNRVKASER